MVLIELSPHIKPDLLSVAEKCHSMMVVTTELRLQKMWPLPRWCLVRRGQAHACQQAQERPTGQEPSTELWNWIPQQHTPFPTP